MHKDKSVRESLVYLDDLTGIYNRRYLKEVQKKIRTLKNKHHAYSVVIVDIDHFKDVNDVYGHPKGDEVIKNFAQFLKSSLRTTDTVLRYGGDEFVCIMPDTTRQDAEQIYIRILTKCRQQKFGDVGITVSVGIGSYPEAGKDFKDLLKIADESLYEAKRSGRDRIGVVKKKKLEIPTRVFINRKDEKETIRKFLTVDKDKARAIIVRGNVGIGKTRLVREVLGGISGQEVLWADCLAFFEEVPYYPVRELIRYRIHRFGAGVLADIPLAYRVELGKLVPEIAAGIKEHNSKIGLVLDRYRLYESVKQMIEKGKKAKIIVIDNMQWVDKNSIEILEYLLRSLSERPITFIFTYRQEEKTEVLDKFISSISRENEIKELSLSSFGRNEIKEIAGSIICEKPGNELVSYIEQESGGNPFYIEELIKGLNETGYLKVVRNKWEFNKPVVEVIPKSIEDITDKKYQSLSKEAKETIEIASVISRFDVSIIKGITNYNEGHIWGLIEDIKRLGLTRERGERLEFQEEVSRQAIYKKNVTGIKKTTLHKGVAEKIEEQYRGRENEAIDELTFHYYHAGDKEKGVQYCIKAGDKAKEKYANSSAIRYYSWALEFLKDKREKEKIKMNIDCLIKRSAVLSLTGDNEGAMRDLDEGLKETMVIKDKKREADLRSKKTNIYLNVSQYGKAAIEAKRGMKIYKEIGDKAGIARSLNNISAICWRMGEYKKALENHEDSLKIMSDTGDKIGKAYTLNGMGLNCFELKSYNKALKYYDAALKIFRETGDKYGEALVLNNIGLLNWDGGNYKKAVSNYENSSKILSDIGDKLGVAKAFNNSALVYGELGGYNKALKYLKDALKIFKDVGDKYGEALASINIGITYSNWGEYREAFKNQIDSLENMRAIKSRFGEAIALNSIGTIYMNWGNYYKALKYFMNALIIAEKINARGIEFESLLFLGDLFLTLNKIKKAKEFIDKAYDIAKSLNSKKMLTGISFLLCDFYLVSRDFDKCKGILKSLENSRKKIRLKSFEGYINLLLGQYHIEVKDFKKARRHLHKSLRIFEKLKERLNIGKSYYYLGMMALVGGKKEISQKHLGKSLEIFKFLGAKAWEAKVKKALRL